MDYCHFNPSYNILNIWIMKKFIALLLSLNLSANVDWSHESSCSILNSEIQEVEHILSKMTLEQKVGQIIMPDLDAVTPIEAKAYQLGTILNGGGKHEFKQCLIGKIESTQQHIENPAGYADQLWNEIKGSCS